MIRIQYGVIVAALRAQRIVARSAEIGSKSVCLNLISGSSCLLYQIIFVIARLLYLLYSQSTHIFDGIDGLKWIILRVLRVYLYDVFEEFRGQANFDKLRHIHKLRHPRAA